MKIQELVSEAYSLGRMPEITDDDYQKEYGNLLLKANKVADVRKNIALYQYNEIYLLVKDNTIIVGHIRLTPITIANKQYLNLVNIFVSPFYRKTSATYWLLYAVKEQVELPVIADGAIFTGGQELIRSILKHKVFNVGSINTDTGKIEPLSGPLNSANHAYLFTTSKLGFGKQIFEGNLPFTWYPLFEEL
jgi:hypothetical protein